MGRSRRRGRSLDGVLLLDKRPGITSNRALQEVKHLLQARKAGHTGSLDPLASGLLPICLGAATRLSAFLLDTDKRYRVTVRFGRRTATGDAEGAVVSTRPVPALSHSDIEAILDRFRGTIEQVPPMFSALKHNGTRLYELARQGIEIERPPRIVTVHELHLLDATDHAWVLDVACSKGTYIRTLADDLGQAVGCGAFADDLRRTRVGVFDIEDAVTFDRLMEMESDAGRRAWIRPLDEAVSFWPTMRLSSASIFYLKQGQSVEVPDAPADGWVRLYTEEGAFIGVGEVVSAGRIAPRRLFS